MSRKQIRTVSLIALTTLLFTGCSATGPAVIVMQITNTPDPRVIPITITNTGIPGPSATPNVTVGAVPNGPSATPEANAPATAVPISTVIPVSSLVATSVPTTAATSTGTVVPVPTDTRVQLYIAQENFQHGYLFWVSSTKEIWALLPVSLAQPDVVPTSGQWRIYKDTYLDSEPESDPSLVPPASTLYQPRRGFGKLWRTNEEVRGDLGWGTTPEFGLTTSYVYQPGGHGDPTTGQWIPGPGTHFVVTLGRETFAFHEPQPGQQYGTWEKVG